MNWIKIEPGCQQPERGIHYLVLLKTGTLVLYDARLDESCPPWPEDATQWAPVLLPTKPDPFGNWWWNECLKSKLGITTPEEFARAGWDAAIAYMREVES